MGVVAALLVLEVHPRVAPPCPCWSFLGRKLFNEAHASINVPSTLKCSSEIQPCEVGQLDDLGEEQVGHGEGDQAPLVLAEDRGVEDGLLQGRVDEPAEQQVGLQPRAQLLVRTHRVECLQYLCPQ